MRQMNWITAILGLWLIIAPFTLGYSTHAEPFWNEITVGLLVAVLAGYLALQEGRGAQRPSGSMGHH